MYVSPTCIAPSLLIGQRVHMQRFHRHLLLFACVCKSPDCLHILLYVNGVVYKHHQCVCVFFFFPNVEVNTAVCAAHSESSVGVEAAALSSCPAQPWPGPSHLNSVMVSCLGFLVLSVITTASVCQAFSPWAVAQTSHLKEWRQKVGISTPWQISAWPLCLDRNAPVEGTL